MRGNAFLPESTNAYLYCRNQPLRYVDPSGNDCYYFCLPEWENEAQNDRMELARYLGIDRCIGGSPGRGDGQPEPRIWLE